MARYADVLNWLRGLAIAAAVLCFFFGIARFPDGPIHPCDKSRRYLYPDHPFGYCGKQGQSHTAADFASYRKWEDITFVLWPLAILSMASLVWQAKNRKL